MNGIHGMRKRKADDDGCAGGDTEDLSNHTFIGNDRKRKVDHDYDIEEADDVAETDEHDDFDDGDEEDTDCDYEDENDYVLDEEFCFTVTSVDEASLGRLRRNEAEGCAWSINLSGRASCGGGDDGIVALCDALTAGGVSVEEFVLDSVGLSLRGVRALSDLLRRPDCSVADVRLLGDDIGDEGVSLLADSVTINDSVRTLDLCRNGFTAKGTKDLAKALGENRTLQHVTVVRNDVGDDGAEALAACLLERQQRTAASPLRGLHLIGCGVGDRGAVAISESLKRSSASLASLCLASNSFGDVGATALAKMLRGNQCIKNLSLEDNPFGRDGTRELAWSLLLNTTLQRVRLSLPKERDAAARNEEGWKFVESAARVLRDDGGVTDSDIQPCVAAFFDGSSSNASTVRSYPSITDAEIAARNLKGPNFDERTITVEGTALDRSPRRGQRKFLQFIYRDGLERLGRYSSTIRNDEAFAPVLERAASTVGADGLYRMILSKPAVVRQL